MSFYFREKPRFGDKLRGKSRDELLQELNQQFDDSKSFFEPTPTRLTRDPFERHTGFSRGFPFDDEGFGRRGNDIRSHLDDLASRHPEFADHLLGPAWGDVPAFHTGSLRRRRGSGSSPSYQAHPDEDARSQASGSSATSAASGASGVSSQGEVIHPERRTSGDRSATGKPEASTPRRNPIASHGLRNTVDIGQHRHDMDNSDKSSRGQRSMSAPPENRQQDEIPVVHESLQQSSQNPNQRFVSRVDITPQFVAQQGGPDRTPPKLHQQQQNQQSQKPQQQQQQQQQQSNVRHIPIFVEGRDKPVITKETDEDQTDGSWTYAKPTSGQFPQPPQFQSPPKFHRPSHFNQHYDRARDWLPNFEEEFYPSQSAFQYPGASSRPPSHFRQAGANRGQNRGHQEQHFSPQSQNPRQSPQQQRTSEQQPQETPVEKPREQTRPKDPLEKVAEVQKEVDALTEEVNLWNGTSRTDKRYMFLDEMLTRELIKLDDIETEGKENVRQARKNAIRSIQDSISLLESKAPLGGSRATVAPESTNEAASAEEKPEATVAMEETKLSEDEAIPLPAAPSSPPLKETSPSVAEERKGEDEENLRRTASPENHVKAEDQRSSQESGQVAMESNTLVEDPNASNMEVQGLPATEETQLETKQETRLEVDNQPMSPKTAKKVKKTRKQTPQQQTPISDGPIPLPAPETHGDTAK